MLNTVKKARKQGYYVSLYYIGLSSAEKSLYHIAKRVSKGGHNISENDVRRRYGKRFDMIVDVIPYCDEVHFYDMKLRMDNSDILMDIDLNCLLSYMV